MIFVTVGTQLPFDRMIRAVDEWAGFAGRRDVFAQAGPTNYQPRFIQISQFIDAVEFNKRCRDADFIVAHLGMGSIITALEMGKPIVVMPRKADLGEHRNDHQAAMAKRLGNSSRITVAWEASELQLKLTEHAAITPVGTDQPARSGSSRSLAVALRQFLVRGAVQPGNADLADEGSILVQAAK